MRIRAISVKAVNPQLSPSSPLTSTPNCMYQKTKCRRCEAKMKEHGILLEQMCDRKKTCHEKMYIPNFNLGQQQCPLHSWCPTLGTLARVMEIMV